MAKGIMASERKGIDRVDLVWRVVSGASDDSDVGGSEASATDSDAHLELEQEHVRARGTFTKLVCVNGNDSLLIEAPTASQLCAAAELLIKGAACDMGGARPIVKRALSRLAGNPYALCLARQL